VRILVAAAFSAALGLALGLCFYWYHGEPLPEAKTDQIGSCTNRQAVADLLGPPTFTYRYAGAEYWEYHGDFLGIRTAIHVDVKFTNGVYCGWGKMD
jgi:hypothetical protein